MIAIIDYGMGNLRSVEKGFLKVGVKATVTNRPEVVDKADGVVLPGVGAFRECMKELTDLNLTDAVVNAIKENRPYLGICLGLQVLFSEAEEFGKCRGLDIFKGKVVKFDFSKSQSIPSKVEGAIDNRQSAINNLKVPHMGWNELKTQRNNPLLDGIPDDAFFYFVHSFYVVSDDSAIVATTTDYGVEFVSSIRKDNVYAVQFHPEKSQTWGLKLLENFGKIVAAQKKQPP
ncbi:imidazole glycerol phosphate synthase subunit HisH 1 [bacterium BMS3Abin10]|nr:imidazole glycerol phosphate synthase subunit HisH 1 [bacterium BMS3Abin10]